jgi:hypothetical protein
MWALARARVFAPHGVRGVTRDAGSGYARNGRDRLVAGERYARIARTDVRRDAASQDVVNQSVAYPYESTRKTDGFFSAMSAKNTLSLGTGYA